MGRKRELVAPTVVRCLRLLARPSPSGKYAYEGQGLSARKLRASGVFLVRRADGRPLDHSRTNVGVNFLNPRARRWTIRVVLCDDGTVRVITHETSRGGTRPRHGVGFAVQVMVFPKRTS